MINYSRLLLVHVICLGSCFFSILSVPVAAEERIVKELRIYTDVPINDDDDDRRSPSELYYEPYYFAPAKKAKDIAVDVSFAASGLDKDAKGTLVEIVAHFHSANEFAQIGFVPAGAPKLGALKGMDVAKALSPGRKQKVYLEFKARRRANDHAKVSFRVGGLAGTPNKDSLRPPATRDPDLDTLSADWQTFRVDVTKRVSKLHEVLCPLNVTIEINNNPLARRDRDPDTREESKYRIVTLYIDDVRFICVEE